MATNQQIRDDIASLRVETIKTKAGVGRLEGDGQPNTNADSVSGLVWSRPIGVPARPAQNVVRDMEARLVVMEGMLAEAVTRLRRMEG